MILEFDGQSIGTKEYINSKYIIYFYEYKITPDKIGTNIILANLNSSIWVDILPSELKELLEEIDDGKTI